MPTSQNLPSRLPTKYHLSKISLGSLAPHYSVQNCEMRRPPLEKSSSANRLPKTENCAAANQPHRRNPRRASKAARRGLLTSFARPLHVGHVRRPNGDLTWPTQEPSVAAQCPPAHQPQQKP